MIALVDYGAGNLDNVLRALVRLGRTGVRFPRPEELTDRPEAVLLPGVGAFPPARAALAASGWDRKIRDLAAEGVGILGICLGMQLLSEGSAEDGFTPGLGLIRGTAERLELPVLPHMGWNRARFVADWAGVGRTGEEIPVYFVHSYALPVDGVATAVCTEAGRSFAALVRRGNVAGVQFHPERSGDDGLALLDRMLSSLTRRVPTAAGAVEGVE